MEKITKLLFGNYFYLKKTIREKKVNQTGFVISESSQTQ